ncbi:MAG: hypothetical protein Q9191_005719 [Dirinaria sp. TL-2023a]
MGQFYSEMRPPTAKFTEKNVPDQTGKVFIVTGSTSGVGFELAYILYLCNAKVYIAARSEDKGNAAIEEIKARVPDSKGQILFLHLDLSDLTTIKSSAEAFLRENERLDVLWNNAGVMIPPQGSKTAQGYELQLGTNCLGPHLFTSLLQPILIRTAKNAPANSVRIVWVSSNGAWITTGRNGIELDNLDYSKADRSSWTKYGASKAGNIFQASEAGRRLGEAGIVSVGWFLYTPIHGAYTELFAGLSPEVTTEQNGTFIFPWGRLGFKIREDLVLAQKPEKEGGTGYAEKFWDWCDEQVKPYK